MVNEEHIKILKKGVSAWNKWRKRNPKAKPDLVRADLREADLDGVDLSHADLSEADLTGVSLRAANLSTANLSSAILSQANLIGAFVGYANLYDTNLSASNLSGADLRCAELVFADLTGANFRGTSVGYTTFADIDLSRVKAIETVKHTAPSSIGIDTIYRSKGKIPVQFLRGAGVPDNFIEYMHSLVGTAFEYYSCFISYSTKDQEFAYRIHADLQDNAVRCWFAPHSLQAGKKLHEQIDNAIRLHERLLLILSPGSINSEWVKTEIAKARRREANEGKRVLFPIRLNLTFEQIQEWECFDTDRGKDSAREIREYYLPDFTRWKNHDRYQEEFKKLLRDLKKESA